MHKDQQEQLRDYLIHGFGEVPGFFHREFVQTLVTLNSVQRAHGVRGGVCEIGVYHGASFIPLALLTRPGESCVAVDCFDLPHANRTGSGTGATEDAFRANVERWAPDAELLVVKGDSLDIVPFLLPARPYRIVSIDGDHSPEGTLHDLGVVTNSTVLAEGGIVIVDDVFNEDWPGVCQGFHDFKRRRPDFPVIALGRNKVVLCEQHHYDAYMNVLGGRRVDFYGRKAARI